MTPERPESEKFTHTEVSYENVAKMPSTICGNCRYFISGSPSRCRIVKEPILHGGWCKKWKPTQYRRKA